MRPMPAVTLILLLLALSLGASSAAPAPSKGVTARPAPALALKGGVRGLYPGARVPLRVTIRNRRRHPVRVRSLGAIAVARGACKSSYVRIPSRRVRLLVPARRSRALVLHVAMRRSAPDACKGAIFRLRLFARGLRA